MAMMEGGEEDAREDLSMHPLWEQFVSVQVSFVIALDTIRRPPRYFFEEESPSPKDGETDDAFFFYSPFSAELSLEWPRSSKRCKGGILADGEFDSPFRTAILLKLQLSPFVQRWDSAKLS